MEVPTNWTQFSKLQGVVLAISSPLPITHFLAHLRSIYSFSGQGTICIKYQSLSTSRRIYTTGARYFDLASRSRQNRFIKILHGSCKNKGPCRKLFGKKEAFLVVKRMGKSST